MPPSKKTKSPTKEVDKPKASAESEKKQERPYEEPAVETAVIETAQPQKEEQGPAPHSSDNGPALMPDGIPETIRPADYRDRMVTLFVREQVQMSPDSPFVFHPRFINKERSRIKAIVRLPDGRFTEMEVDRSDLRSPLLRDVFAQYTEDEIELFTQRHLRVAEVRRQLDLRIAEDKQVADLRDAAYQAKVEAFKIPAVNAEQNKEIRRRIRQAGSVMEVYALTSLALMNTLGSNSSEHSDDEGELEPGTASAEG